MEEKKIITKELEQYYQEQGLVRIQSHPTLDLKIINYSEKVTYENLWDENLLQYRALVYNSNYDVVARSFNRFFNLEEGKHKPTDDFEIFEKLDGSLILVFWYLGKMIVASRGSFTSPYAVEARRILDEKYPKFEKLVRLLDLNNNITFCFELIGFEQIVVSYPESNLVATGCFQHGRECTLNYSENNLLFDSIPIVKKFDGLDWQNIKDLNWKNAEGFVVRFSNGDRCKIKFEDYIKLHRQMTNLSTRGIWEALAAGEPVSSILNEVPDEFYDKIRIYESTLVTKYKSVEALHQLAYMGLSGYGYTRREFANKVLSLNHLQVSINPIILFSMLDGKDYSKHIWKMIEPEYQKL